MNHTDLLEALHWRYATKQFDPESILTSSQIDTLSESLRLSPSSFGLQGRGFIIVENKDIRQQLLPHARNQSQIVDASHLFVLCRRTDVDSKFIDKFFSDMAQTRNIELSQLDGYKKMVLWTVQWQSPIELENRLTKQVYIAQGFLLSACAMLSIDACPMEGFSAQAFDEILWLQKHNLTSCVVVPVWYRSSDDTYATLPKVRFPKEEIIIYK